MPSIARILLVDDHPADLLALEAALNPLRQGLVRARSGPKALELAQDDDFAVVLLDMQIPGLDALQTAVRMKRVARARYTPIIFLTASMPTTAELATAYRHGAVDILLKPFDPDILKSKVSVFVELFLRRDAIEDTGLSRHKAEALAERVARLHGLTSALSEAMTTAQVAEVIVREGVERLGAEMCSLHGFTDDGAAVERLAERGVPATAGRRGFCLDPAAGHSPAETALRSGDAVWIESPSELTARFPAAAAAAAPHPPAFFCAPLRMEGRALGVLGLGFSAARHFTDEDRSFFETVARQCGQAMERARLYDAERRANERLRLSVDVWRILSSTLDYDETIGNLTRALVPNVGEWCCVDMLEDDAAPRTVALAHVDTAKGALGKAARVARPVRVTDTAGVMRVLQTGVSELLHGPLEGAAGEATGLDALAATLGMTSVMIVPLRGRGRTLGALTLASTQLGRRYTRADVAFLEEIGARAALAADNARLRREAQYAIHSRDEFLTIASHELNTPLTPLKLQIGTLRRRVHTPEKLASKLEVADRQVDRLTNLVRQLLDVSRISAGRLELECERLDMRAVVLEAAGRVEAQLGRASRVTVLSGEPVVGCWDKVRLDQIATNLVSNAVKYGAGKPIDVAITRDGVRARLAVQDHGIGIAPDHQARIFGQFERAVSSRNFGGFGLGLWIVRRLVEASGGSIAVDSAPGEGSTFTVELPIASLERESAA